MATPRLVELIDRYRNAHGVSEAELARRIGISRENLRKWRANGVSRLPDRTNLAAVARVIGRPYREILSAALFDTGYLTDAQAAIPRPYGEVLHDAVSVLTEASRLRNQTMRQTVSGQWEVDPDPRAAVPIDWAEFVTLALAGAAANVGGIENILAGRSGSWEAECVRQTLHSTVADDNDLMRHRTDPITVDLWVEAVLAYSTDTTEDDYQAAEMELLARQEAVPLPDDIPPGPFSPDDPRLAQIDRVSVENGNLIVAQFADWPPDYAEKLPVVEELLEEARNSRGDTPGEIAYEQAFDEIAALSDALDNQRQADYADYAARLTAAIETKLRELSSDVPITVAVAPAPAGTSGEEYDAHRLPDYPTDVISTIIEGAIMDTPTPSAAATTGTPLDRVAAYRPESRRGEKGGGDGE
jgi:transcriptional regulator with XRE-family HTH domain